MSKQQLTVKTFRIADIRVRGQHRPLVEKKVRELADSINVIGLKTPPTVQLSKKGPILVTGQHRVEAAKLLGWKKIECSVMRGDKTERRQCTIAENLHRADLTRVQRAEMHDEWFRLLNGQSEAVQVAQPEGTQPRDKGLSRAAKQLNISREEARRSKKIAGISPAAKTAAKAAGLDDNQQALLEVAKEPTPKRQIERVQELAKQQGDSRRSSLSRQEAKQLKALKLAFKRARLFKQAWNKASSLVQKKFIKVILQPSC